ncbi:MAG: hypothetical protein WD020_01780 [Acidimicrobiia bacterium]
MRIINRFLVLWAAFVGVAVGTGVWVKLKVRPEDDPTAPRFALVTVFDGTDFRPTTRELVSSTAITMFGGCRLDLRRARTSGAETVRLDLTTVMGGCDVTVPDTWRVTVSGLAVAGGHDVRVANPDELAADAPSLAIHARTLMGGLSVRARPVIQSAD